MGGALGRANGSGSEPPDSNKKYSKIEKLKRPALVGTMLGLIGTGTVSALSTIGSWAASGTLGATAASFASGLVAALATHYGSSAAEARQKKAETAQSASDSGLAGSSATAGGSGSGVSVLEVISAANAGIRQVKEDVLSPLAGIHTRLELALATATEVSKGTDHASAQSIRDHVEKALSKITEIRDACGPAAEKADGWVKGL